MPGPRRTPLLTPSVLHRRCACSGADVRRARREQLATGLPPALTPAEQQALPWAIARQPLWGIGGWVAVLDDERTARAHARATFPAVGRALDVVAGIAAWQAGLW